MSPRWKPLPGEQPEPQPIATSLDRVAASLGVPQASTLSLFQRWPELVGDDIAAHSEPVALRDQVLVVAVDQPVWATQLRWLEADLVVRLGEALGPGQVARIELRVVPR